MHLEIKYLRLSGVRFADVCRYADALPPERREKIEKLRFEKDKLLSLAAGLLIRHEVGETPLECNEHGKPYAVGGRFFSVSHSGDHVAIAVDDQEIGVDVEKLPDKDYMKIAERFYHPNELEYVKTADDPKRAFARIWTRKEAYLKQLGIGIATDLKAFDTTAGELSKRSMSVDLDGYVISVCTADTIKQDKDYISEIELKSIV